MPTNPYQTPQLEVQATEKNQPDPKLTRSATALRQTKPWVRLISVFMFLGAGALIIGGGFFMIFGMANGNTTVFAGILYGALSLLYIIPATFLWKYANCIETFLQDNSPGSLASALESQKSFWKFCGIMLIIIIVMYAAMFGAMMLAFMG